MARHYRTCHQNKFPPVQLQIAVIPGDVVVFEVAAAAAAVGFSLGSTTDIQFWDDRRISFSLAAVTSGSPLGIVVVIIKQFPHVSNGDRIGSSTWIKRRALAAGQ